MKSAFRNGELQEDVFVEHPPGLGVLLVIHAQGYLQIDRHVFFFCLHVLFSVLPVPSTVRVDRLFCFLVIFFKIYTFMPFLKRFVFLDPGARRHRPWRRGNTSRRRGPHTRPARQPRWRHMSGRSAPWILAPTYYIVPAVARSGPSLPRCYMQCLFSRLVQ